MTGKNLRLIVLDSRNQEAVTVLPVLVETMVMTNIFSWFDFELKKLLCGRFSWQYCSSHWKATGVRLKKSKMGCDKGLRFGSTLLVSYCLNTFGLLLSPEMIKNARCWKGLEKPRC